MLKGIDLTKIAGNKNILDEVSFEIPSGTTATVLGPSGSGKTTLLRTIMGLECPDAGELHFEDQCLAADGQFIKPEHRNISLVFQEFTLFPNMNVADNIAFGMKRKKNARTRIEDLLELLEIGHLKKRRIDQLSGGEQQRVALARALIIRPRILLMDEPFSNIDNMLRGRLYSRLYSRLAEFDMTTLIATHDHKEAFYFSDSILVMKDGRLIDQNPPKLIYEQPANIWVAEFFGETNVLNSVELQQLIPNQTLKPDCSYVIRPEFINIIAAEGSSVTATVKQIEYYGAYQDIQVSLESGLELRTRCTGSHNLVLGQRIGLSLHNQIVPHAVDAVS